MEQSIYCDYCSTTPIRPEVLEVMKPFLTTDFGNASNQYDLGIKSKMAIELSRETISNMLGVEPEEIFFTSGGSESNTWALTRLVKNFFCTKDGEMLISPIEHHSVIHAACSDNFVQVCDVNLFGRIVISDLIDKINNNTYMISTMWVNNEIGTIEPIEEISNICAEKGIYLHVDAVQAFGHIPINLSLHSLKGITTLSASAHKIGGPKGIGFLYMRKDIQKNYKPLIYGGKQEFEKRGGTENVASIVGFAKACELAKEEMTITNYNNIRGLTAYAWDFLLNNISNCRLNGLPIKDKRRMPHILNISIEGINGEELVSILNEQGIYVSTGSACNSGSPEPSHVLKSIGLSDDLANGSIRISFGPNTKLIEVNKLCQKIVEDVEILRRRR